MGYVSHVARNSNIYRNTKRGVREQKMTDKSYTYTEDITFSGGGSSVVVNDCCDYYYKVPDSDVKVQCLKNKGHKDKHFICGMFVQ